ncbi:MAG TPA: PKD domain-containing protein [Cytophagales bacterium]|nr:PKD domain-containing protein [Cytophagales bacterium]
MKINLLKSTGLIFAFTLAFAAAGRGQCLPSVSVTSPYPAPGVKYPAATANLKNVFNVIPNASSSYDYSHSFKFAALDNFTIKFGDGSSDFHYNGEPITSVVHTYKKEGLFVYEIINNNCSDNNSVQGKIYNGKDKDPSILGGGFPPADNICVPYDLAFINSSLGLSPFFEFDWDFGDTPSSVYDTTLNINNGLGAIAHTYSNAYSRCGIYVKFRVRKILPNNNFVTFLQTGGPYNFITTDVPKVNKSEILLCERGIDQELELTDASSLTCISNLPRTIRWDIMNEPVGKPLTLVSGSVASENNYYVAANKKIKVKVPASALNGDVYKVRLIVNNPCGPDTTFSTIKITLPSKPTFSFNNNGPICPGKKLSFRNTSVERGQSGVSFYWDVYNEKDVRVSSIASNNELVDILFPLPGVFKVVLRERVTSNSVAANAPYCEASSDNQPVIVVSQNVVAKIENPFNNFCIKSDGEGNTPFNIKFGNGSLSETATSTYKWFVSKVGEDTTSFPVAPSGTLKDFSLSVQSHGRYIVKLEAFDPLNSCTKTIDLDTIFVFPQPISLIKAADGCAGEEVILRDSSKVIAAGNFGLPEDFQHLKVSVDFRDGSPVYSYFKNVNASCEASDNLYTTAKMACTKLTKHKFTKPGQYWVKFTIAAGDEGSNYCPVVDSVLVNVNPLPAPSFSGIGDGCTPFSVKLINTTAGREHISGFVWNVNGQDIPAPKNSNFDLDTTFSKPGVYKVILKAKTAKGCESATAVKTINVFANPQFEISSNYSTFLSNCSPLNLKFNADMAATSFSSIQSAIWSFYDGDGAQIGGDTILKVTTAKDLEINQKFVNSTFVEKKFKATLLIKFKNGGCEKLKESEFTINPRPLVEYAMDKTEGCSPLTVQFSIDKKDVNPSAEYTWSFPGGSQLTSNNPNPAPITFVNLGTTPVTRTIRLTTTSLNGCSDFTEKTITIKPQSVPNFNIVNNRRLCSGDSLKFENKSTGSVASKLVWVWGDSSPNDTVPASTPYIWHKFENESVDSESAYEVKLHAISDCVVESQAKTITVERKLKSDFDIHFSSICSPVEVNLISLSEGPVSSFIWKINGKKLSDRSSNFNHTLINNSAKPKNYQITLITLSPNGCADSLTKEITVNPEITASFKSQKPETTSCSPVEYGFINNSEGNAASYEWDFGDGTIETVTSKATLQHVFQNLSSKSTTYRVTLTAITTEECRYSTFTDLIIAPSGSADFEMDSVGCSPFEVVFKNKSLRSGEMEWDFGNGAVYSGTNPPKQTYINTGSEPITFKVTLKAGNTNGCEDTKVKELTVYPEAQPSFVASPAIQDFPNSTVTFENTSNKGHWDYHWDFGDGEYSSEKDPLTHTYKSPGNYKVTLTLSNEYCSKEFVEGVKIVPQPPLAKFSADVTKGCRPLTVNFKNLTENSEGANYTWEFGDGFGMSNAENPQYTFYEPGKYTVKLTALNSEGKQSNETKEYFIEVSDLPIAAFQFNRSVIHIPEEQVNFVNLSMNAESYLWDFGDGNTSYEKDPSYVYSDTGTYTITLIAFGKEGCSDTSTVEKAIKATTNGSVKVPNAFTPSLNGSSSRNISSEGLNDIFLPIINGIDFIEMRIYNRWGEVMYSYKGTDCPGWNGYYKGKLCKQDIYIYNIKARLRNGETIERVGDVMLLN